jgi:hypothetical protein
MRGRVAPDPWLHHQRSQSTVVFNEQTGKAPRRTKFRWNLRPGTLDPAVRSMLTFAFGNGDQLSTKIR